jgi:signal recognition particle GTPase
MGDLHAELVCIRDIDVVVADRAGRDSLDTKLMELVKDLGRHRIRDDRDSI